MVTTRRLRALCLLFPDFDTLDVTLFCSVLASAGQRWNHRAFELSLGALGPRQVPGRPLPLLSNCTLSDIDPVDVVFVPGGRGALAAADDSAWVAELARVGGSARARCAVGAGQVALASAGLLGKAACAGSDIGAELAKRFPDVRTDGQREFLVEGPCYLGSTSLSVLPLALELVACVLGSSEADHVARALGQHRRAPRLELKS
jgi:transcriptional regulator GlxA family with amidase domain